MAGELISSKDVVAIVWLGVRIVNFLYNPPILLPQATYSEIMIKCFIHGRVDFPQVM